MTEISDKNWQYYIAFLMRKLWAACALILVTLAVLISILRAVLPHMDAQKHHLEQWLASQYGADVKIGYISAMWKGKGPAIVLKDVSLAQDANSPIALNVDETQVELDFFSSLQSWQVQSERFNLIGLELQVDLPRIQNNGDDFPILEALQTLFLERLQRFSVSNSEVLLKTRLDQQRIQIQQLSWLNKNERHQGVGQMRVAELARNSASFVMDLYGSKDNFQGMFYAEAEDLDISPWLKALIPTEYELQRSRGNFKLWAGILNSNVTFVQANIKDSRFAWQSEASDDNVTANLVRGDFAAKPVEDGWEFNFDDFTLLINERAITSNWSGKLDQEGSFYLNAIDAVNLTPMLPMVGVMMGEDVAEQVNALAPTIELAQAQFKLSENDMFAKVAFANMGIEQHNKIPGIQHLEGDVFWHNQQGNIVVQGTDEIVFSQQLLGYDLPYQSLSVEAYVDLREAFNRLILPGIQLHTEHLSVQQSVSYQFDTQELSLSLSADGIPIENVKSLLPKNLIGPDTLAYLERALVSGRVTGADVIWQGNPAAFPFLQQQGIFQAKADVEDVTFVFEPQWPAIEKLHASALFENESLYLAGRSGNIVGIELLKADGVLPELAETGVLVIDAKARGNATQLTELMQNSTLADSVGVALTEMQVNGELASDLTLTIPLTGEDVIAKGQGQLLNNQIMIPSLDLTLENVQGQLQFENELITANEVSAALLTQPITLTVQGKDTDQGYKTDINVAGSWQVEPLVARYMPSIEGYFSGASGWQANIDLWLPATGYKYNMQLLSQLDGITMDLPAPLAKTSDDSMRFILDSEGDTQASTVRMLVGSDVKFNGIFPHKERRFSRAHLSIGGDNFVGMGLGFSVSADVETFEYSPWYQFIGKLIDGLPQSENPMLEAPQRVFIEAQEAIIAGHRFEELEVLAKNREVDWLLNVNSKQSRAEVKIHKDWDNEGVDIKADFVKLGGWNTTISNDEDPIDSKLLPPLSFICKQCQYKEYDLGQITLNMSRSMTGMSIDLLEMRKRDGVLSATGNWYVSDEGNATRIKGNFNSDDFGAFLKNVEIDTGIRDSDATMDFDLNWRESPYEFNTATLGGHIDWRLGDGYFTEVSDQGARIFGILSLESLVRKLRLDFRDVFAKGFFYNRMDGSFEVSDGLVKTEDAVIDGAAAKVRLNGYTDLSENNLNYVVSVQPNITSSLPVLLAWMVNPATAVAALALDEVFASANVISSLEYSLTGTLAQPVITEMDRQSKTVALPAQNKLLPEAKPTDPPTKKLKDTEG
ncbi:MAG: YhdP family protein [Aestuariibacter sp.]